MSFLGHSNNETYQPALWFGFISNLFDTNIVVTRGLSPHENNKPYMVVRHNHTPSCMSFDFLIPDSFWCHKEWRSIDCIAVRWPQCGSKGLQVTLSLIFGPEEEAPSSVRPPIGAQLPVSPHVSVTANIWLRRLLLAGYTCICFFPVCLELWLLHCLKVIITCKCSLKNKKNKLIIDWFFES